MSPGDEPNDWRGATLRRIRALIHEADPDVVEDAKWVKPTNPSGVPTWQHDGIICTGEIYKAKVKVTFARGASLPDPTGLFNASLDAGTRRAIDIGEGDELDERSFTALIRAAVALNTGEEGSASQGASRPPADGRGASSTRMGRHPSPDGSAF